MIFFTVTKCKIRFIYIRFHFKRKNGVGNGWKKLPLVEGLTPDGKSHDKFPLFLRSLSQYLVSPYGSFFVVAEMDSLFGLSASNQAVRQNR